MSLLGWMVYALAVGLLIGGGALTLDRGLARTGLPTRWIWVCAVVLSAGIPLAALVLPTASPALGAAGSSTSSAMETGSAPLLSADPAGVEAVGVGPVALLLERSATAVSRAIQSAASLAPAGREPERWVAAAWWAGSLALGLTLLFSALALARRRRGWPRVHVRQHTVRVAPDVGPAVVGFLRPEIVLPPWVVAMEAGDLDLVLAHESQHLRARDPLLLLAGLVPVCLLPWNPLLWWQLRRLRDAVELDCDRRVLRRGIARRRYGDLLLRMGSHSRTDILPAAAMAGTPSLLERRLDAMKKRSVRTSIPLGLAAAVLAAGLVVLACEADAPTAMDADDAAVLDEEEGSAGRYLLASRLFEIAPDPLVVVDGVIQSRAVTELSPSDIESVEVVKGAAAAQLYGARAENGVVLVTTFEGARNSEGEAQGLDRVEAVEEMDEEVVDEEEAAEERGPGEISPEGEVTLERGVRVRLRHSGDLRSGARPLMVIDGVIVNSEAVDLDALDIESIEVLKGAAAAGLYGSRASAGVVAITTRNGGG